MDRGRKWPHEARTPTLDLSKEACGISLIFATERREPILQGSHTVLQRAGGGDAGLRLS
jgi:hypothetical protein